MLTKLTVRNFKRFSSEEIELDSPVVFVGPNNSGKTCAMQALALWGVGLRRWNERHAGKTAPEKRPGVTVGRRDLVAAPVPSARLLWRGLSVRKQAVADGARGTSNVRMDIIVEGVGEHGEWKCGLEFDYANEESFYCRPLRSGESSTADRMPIPDDAARVTLAYLPPMSGLAATETRLEHGAVSVRVGEGRTAEVLRNLCHRVCEESPEDWERLVGRVEHLFGVELNRPRHIVERGEIDMTYRERGITLDLSSSGRGLQQTMLLLAYLSVNRGSVLLLDEPDAHLETLRQRQTYRTITESASESGSQVIAASHSEVVLSEAASKDAVVAFVGRPHRIEDRFSQVLKSLKQISFDHYLQAEQTGWVLYLEGSTDLAVLQAFARRLDHAPALSALDKPFVHYVGNQPNEARSHFYGLREALPSLRGVALFDRMETGASDTGDLEHLTWRRREIENYLCTEATLMAFAERPEAGHGPLDLLARRQHMTEAIERIASAMRTLGRGSPWSADAKVSDDFLKPLFGEYFSRVGLPSLLAKKSFHELADLVPDDEMDPEITEKLDAIAAVASPESPVAEF